MSGRCLRCGEVVKPASLQARGTFSVSPSGKEKEDIELSYAGELTVPFGKNMLSARHCEKQDLMLIETKKEEST